MEQKTTQLFDNRVLERLTRVHHNTPFFVYIPLNLLCLSLVLVSEELYWPTFPVCLALGFFVWTFFEYILHRIVFHYQPKSNFGKRMHYLFHGIHHDFPQEADRLVMPPSSSLPIATIVFLIFYIPLGMAGVVTFVGFLSGYLYYELVHYSVHHKKNPGVFWNKAQQKNHLQHHFKNYNKQFGVTTTFWDRVFGTY